MALAQARRSTCPRGHAYDCVSSGRRRCLQCKRERWHATHPKPTLAEYVWSRISRDETTRCWRWIGTRASTGYGTGSYRGRAFLAHREVYELLVGPIAPGLTIDHVHERGCRFRDCVNPAHLEPVTIGENARRAVAARRKPTCPAGHPFDEANTGRNVNGWRYCKTCNRLAAAAYYAAKGGGAV